MKKKILFYITTLDGGGAEKVLLNLLRCIDLQKYDITVATLFGGKYFNSLPKAIHCKTIFNTKNKQIRKVLCYFCYKLLSPSRFHSLFLNSDYDIEIAYLTGYPSKIIQNSVNKTSRKVCFIHGIVDKPGFLESIYGDLKSAKELYQRVDKVCFVSEANKARFISKFGDIGNLLVLHNIVDVDEILNHADAVCDTGYDQSKINLVSVGRLTEVKGYDRLLRIACKLNEEFNNYTLTIVGEGNLEQSFKDYILKNNLSNVRIVPFQKNPFPYVKQADLFVCSSLSEGYSTAVSEAALIGTPVITVQCDGMDEIYREGIGCRIVDNDELLLYNCIKHFLSDAEFRKTLKDEAVIKQSKYTLEVSKNYFKYEELLDNL